MDGGQRGGSHRGQYEVQKKRDVKTAYQRMSAEERESLKWNLTEINKAAAGDEQSTTANITLVYNIY